MKKETAKWLVQIIISILTAIATALGTTSCINKNKEPVCNEQTTEMLCTLFEDTTYYFESSDSLNM